MNPFNIKCKKIFITFLVFIILISCFSQVFATVNTSNLKVGDKLEFKGTRWFVYKSKIAALTRNNSDVTFLEAGDTVTVKDIFR